MHIIPRTLRALRGFVLGIPLLLLGSWGAIACKSSPSPSSTGHTGAGGQGGCPVHPPEAQFVLEIRAEDGPVPPDTRVAAEWSAATEPPFVLSDKTTWKTLDDGVNLVCFVDGNPEPPIVDLAVLNCELWTSGAVNLFVEGTGYDAHEETLKPVMDEFCNQPMSTTVSIMLRRPDPDGGTMP